MKTLVLVRHGKPQPAGPGMADALRELTPAGRAAIAGPAGFPRTFALLSPEERAGAVIWASPAVRARQTAEVAASALDGVQIVERPCLWEQDGTAFLADVDAADARCIVAVGHIPFMNELAAYLTNMPLAFAPGAAAAIELDGPAAQGAGRLAWFVQGPAA